MIKHKCRVFKDRLTGMWRVYCYYSDQYLRVEFLRQQNAFELAFMHATNKDLR